MVIFGNSTEVLMRQKPPPRYNDYSQYKTNHISLEMLQ